MIKISANLSKKVPLPGIDYSSQQFGAAMEIEVSDADQPEAIHGRIRDLYALLSQSVDEQIAGAAQQPANDYQAPPANVVPIRSQPVQNVPPPVQQRPAYTNGNGRNRIAAATTNGIGNGRRVTCTESQAKCIYAICKSQGLDMLSVLADYNVADARDLHVKDASRLIDQLKAQQNGAAH
ncbi:MAG: hypothetical protein WCT04_07660 [Planctomycetota bacterium]